MKSKLYTMNYHFVTLIHVIVQSRKPRNLIFECIFLSNDTRPDDVGVKAITRSVLGKNGEKGEEVTDERLKGIEPKMIELIMNEVTLKPGLQLGL